MKSLTVELQYDERVLSEPREAETKLEEQLHGTSFKVVTLSHETSKDEKKEPLIKDDRDTTGAGGQTSPPEDPPPIKQP